MKLYCSSLFLVCCIVACSSEDDPDTSGTGGAGSGGSSSGGNSQGTGASPATGGAGTGGDAATGGAATGGAGMGGIGGMGGDTSEPVECTDENSVVAEPNVWTDIPELGAETVPCLKIVVPDFVYATLNVKIQNNDTNVDGVVVVTGNGFAKDFGSLSSVNAQVAILDLEKGNSLAEPHAAPYYVKVSDGLSGQQLAWELVY
jgi:hypothetical protein